MERKEILDLLIAEREYHTNHPTEVSIKFLYTLGGIMSAISIGILSKSNNSDASVILSEHSNKVMTALIIFGLGILSIIFGIIEHNKIHRLQQKRLEQAIEFIINPNNHFDYKIFWANFGLTKFHTNKDSDTFVMLVTREPDTRKWLYFHDRKIELGIILIIIGVIILITPY